MADETYTMKIIPLESLNFSGTSGNLQYLDGSGWWGKTTSYTTAGATTANVVGQGDFPDMTDDPLWPRWSESDGSVTPAHTQVLGQPLEIGGVTYPAGAAIEDEYEITLQDAEGNTYVLTAISITEFTTDGAGGIPSAATTKVVGFIWDGAAPPAGVTLTTVYGGVRDHQTIDPNQATVCFAAGTMIRTPKGDRRVEDLAIDDLVTTVDHGPQPVRWVGCSPMTTEALARNEKLRPIRIRAGALGDGVPLADLLVSPQHRILVRSKVAERLFGAREVLISAKQLLQIDGVDVAEDVASVDYYHVLFDRHEVVVSNGAETESLFTGPQALKSIGRAAVEEIFTLFPQLRDRDYTPAAARILVSGRQGRKMIMRHIQHKRDLVAVA
ncbi:MAG TPA: Hint domain-containing protein [Paenirhodobacter sp.]